MRLGRLTAGMAKVLGTFAMLAATSPASAQSPRRAIDRDLTVVNHSHKSANEVYVSPEDAPDWGDERLGGEVVAPGRSFRVRLGRVRDCRFDVQFVYLDGSREELHGVDICRANQVAFDGSQSIDVPSGTPHPVTIVNDDMRPIQQVFLSEAEAAQWGDDRASSHSLSVGGRLQIAFQGGCTVDLRVIFDNRAAEERRGLDICATPVLSIQPGWTTSDAPPVPPVSNAVAAIVQPPTPEPASASTPASESPPMPAEPRRSSLRVVNNTGHDVSELYLYPEGRADHGPDVLGNAVLRGGAVADVTVARGDSCRLAAHVVFTGQVPDREFPPSDVCGTPELDLTP